METPPSPGVVEVGFYAVGLLSHGLQGRGMQGRGVLRQELLTPRACMPRVAMPRVALLRIAMPRIAKLWVAKPSVATPLHRPQGRRLTLHGDSPPTNPETRIHKMSRGGNCWGLELNVHLMNPVFRIPCATLRPPGKTCLRMINHAL